MAQGSGFGERRGEAVLYSVLLRYFNSYKELHSHIICTCESVLKTKSGPLLEEEMQDILYWEKKKKKKHKLLKRPGQGLLAPQGESAERTFGGAGQGEGPEQRQVSGGPACTPPTFGLSL